MTNATFTNAYEDLHRAASYSDLAFPGTYSLAYRDLPEILREHAKGLRALDFGCGAGRSTRFLRSQGYTCIGVDISESMISKARSLDPNGGYHLLTEQDNFALPESNFDVILAAFPFDNIKNEEKRAIFSRLEKTLAPEGILIMLGCSTEIYIHEWASFSTKDFPENFVAQNGDIVRTIMKDVIDKRPVDDIFCTDELYRSIFAESGLRVRVEYRPLAHPENSFNWISETTVAPWVIYVLEKAQ